MSDPFARDLLRSIPKVDDLLADEALAAAAGDAPRPLLLDAIREELEAVRQTLLADPAGTAPLPGRATLIERIAGRLALARRPGLRRVVNGTGIIVHTNLGRAPLAEEAIERLVEVARHPSTLEFDLEFGRRGSRHAPLRHLLTRLTGAEDALVVNNNAAAVLLALNSLARGREAVVSRGELVEIGGSFRIPDVMARSGAIMHEVGTTNRTHPADYETAIGPSTALLLKVHTSNYRVVGFTSEVQLADLVALGRRHGVPVMEDLGSGGLVALDNFGLAGEPTVRQSIAAGVDLVTFSGDKLLGGPQAGIIVGRRELIRLLDGNPLHRALRIDKFTVAALEATLRLYLEGDRGVLRIPVMTMIAVSAGELTRRGRSFLRRVRGRLPNHLRVRLVPCRSQVGGGSLPLRDLESAALEVTSTALSAKRLEEGLRAADPPVIGRIESDALLLDLRTIPATDLAAVAAALEHLGP